MVEEMMMLLLLLLIPRGRCSFLEAQQDALNLHEAPEGTLALARTRNLTAQSLNHSLSNSLQYLPSSPLLCASSLASVRPSVASFPPPSSFNIIRRCVARELRQVGHVRHE